MDQDPKAKELKESPDEGKSPEKAGEQLEIVVTEATNTTSNPKAPVAEETTTGDTNPAPDDDTIRKPEKDDQEKSDSDLVMFTSQHMDGKSKLSVTQECSKVTQTILRIANEAKVIAVEPSTCSWSPGVKSLEKGAVVASEMEEKDGTGKRSPTVMVTEMRDINDNNLSDKSAGKSPTPAITTSNSGVENSAAATESAMKVIVDDAAHDDKEPVDRVMSPKSAVDELHSFSTAPSANVLVTVESQMDSRDTKGTVLKEEVIESSSPSTVGDKLLIVDKAVAVTDETVMTICIEGVRVGDRETRAAAAPTNDQTTTDRILNICDSVQSDDNECTGKRNQKNDKNCERTLVGDGDSGGDQVEPKVLVCEVAATKGILGESGSLGAIINENLPDSSKATEEDAKGEEVPSMYSNKTIAEPMDIVGSQLESVDGKKTELESMAVDADAPWDKDNGEDSSEPMKSDSSAEVTKVCNDSAEPREEIRTDNELSSGALVIVNSRESFLADSSDSMTKVRSIAQSQVVAQRPKLLANLKPKSPHPEDDELDDDEPTILLSGVEDSVQPANIGNRISECSNSNSRVTLPLRSSVVVAPGRVTMDSQPRPSMDGASPTAGSTYINKRSSLYVNSPDFSKKSSPSTPSLPSGSPFRTGMPSTATSPGQMYDPPGFPGSTAVQAIRPPVVMHLKGGDQNEAVPNKLSTLKMKTPDFSKLSSPNMDPSMASVKTVSGYQKDSPVSPSPSYYKSQTMDPYQFHEIRKKYNYISDLQLKPPSEPTVLLPASTRTQMETSSKPSTSSTSQSSSGIYSNLYVNTPEFTAQKFAAGQRSTSSAPLEQPGRFVANSGPWPNPVVAQGPPAAQHQPQHADKIRTDVRDAMNPRASYPMYESAVPQPSMKNYKAAPYPEEFRRDTVLSGRSQLITKPDPGRLPEGRMPQRENLFERETGIGPSGVRYSYSDQPAMSSSFESQPQYSKQIDPRYDGSAESNYLSSVIKTYSQEVPPQRSLPQHDLSQRMIASQQQPKQSTHHPVSLKQQQTDLLRTDLKRINSPNQAASVGYLQMGAPFNPPVQPNSWNPSRSSNMSAGPGNGFQQPNLLRMVPSSSPLMRSNVESPVQQQQQQTQYNMVSQHGPRDNPQSSNYKERIVDGSNQGMETEKYASTGDLSRPLPNHHLVRHGSVDRYIRGSVKNETPVGARIVMPEYYGQYIGHPGQQPVVEDERLSRNPNMALNRGPVQMPLSNHPKFQQGHSTTRMEPPSSSRGPQIPTVVAVKHQPEEIPPQTVQSTSLSSVPRVKRESPLDLSVKTVKTKADSTGGYYDGGLSAASMGSSKPSTSFKVNYVPNFGQPQGSKKVHPNESNQMRHNYIASGIATQPPHQQLVRPPHTTTATGSTFNHLNHKSGYGTVQPHPQSNYPDSRQSVALSMRSTPIPVESSQNQSYSVTGPFPHSQDLYLRGQQEIPQGILPPNLIANAAGPRSHGDDVNQYRNVVPTMPPMSRQVPRADLPAQVGPAVERKRHADFAHLPTTPVHQPPAQKTMKVVDSPYQQPTPTTMHGPFNVYTAKEGQLLDIQSSPQPHLGSVGPAYHYQVQEASNRLPVELKYRPAGPYPGPVYNQVGVHKQEPNFVGPIANYAPRSDVVVDQKPRLPIYSSQVVARPDQPHPSHFHRYGAAPDSVGMQSPVRYSQPGQIMYSGDQHYLQSKSVHPYQMSASHPSPMPMLGCESLPGIKPESIDTEYEVPSIVLPQVPPQQHAPQFADSRSAIVVAPSPPVKCPGADRSVISKLKNTIEEKKQQRLIQMQTSSSEGPLEDNKADIASLLAARIRTKGELKGYTGPPNTSVMPKIELESPDLSINPKERFDPPADMEGVSGFDLLDWGSACNDFVEQLQTGKKKPKRRKLPKSTDVKSELKIDAFSHKLLTDRLPPESLVPREAIETAASLSRPSVVARKDDVVSDGSSDEDKPLVLIRQLSLEKTKVTESDANSRSSSLLMNAKERSGVFVKGVKEKRLLQEKRYAARIANASSSESDTETVKPQKPFKRKKGLAKSGPETSSRKIRPTASDSSQFDFRGDRQKHPNKSMSEPQNVERRNQKSVCDSSEEEEKRKLLAKKTTMVTVGLKRLKADMKPDRGKSEIETSDSESNVSPAKKSKNVLAAKSLSDAENKAGFSKGTPTPTRTTKMRRTLSKDVGSINDVPNKKKKVLNLKAKHMTRATKKQELAAQKANSLVLRNDKVIQSGNPVKRGRGLKRKSSTPDRAKGKKAVSVFKAEVASSSNSEDEEDATTTSSSSSSESDAETIVSGRLRPRKAKGNEPDQNVRGSTVEKKMPKGNSSVKLEKRVPDERTDVAIAPAITTKRGATKRSHQDHKEKTVGAGEKGDAGNQVEKKTKKAGKNQEDPQKFDPGWEDQLYEFKRSLKVPASLITIESPKWHRVSTSLPDLEPRSNSEEEDLHDDSVEKIDASPIVKRPTSTLSSIIDLVHQRVISPIKRLTHIGTATPDAEKKKSRPSTGSEKPADLLLPTPVLVKLSRPKGPDKKDMEDVEEVSVRTVFQTKTVKKSRTRREYHVEKNKEILREIFGGEDRPASAPPGCGAAAGKKPHGEEEKHSSDKVTEYEAIVINKTTYEQKFEEYLGLYSTPEDSCTVSDRSLQQAMSIDEAIRKDVMIFQRPMAQGEEHVVKRRRGYTRRKGSSGFDYIRKKKRPVPVNGVSGPVVNSEVTHSVRKRAIMSFHKERNEQDISKEIKGWVLNKGVGESVLHKATRMNLLDVVAYCLIRLNMAPDQKDFAGYTPLHEACTRGSLDIARLLLQHGANPSETSPSGIRPLHDAVENGFMEIVRILLAYGADPKLSTYAGQTPLDLAEDDEEMEDFLKAHLSDLQAVGRERKAWKFSGAWMAKNDPELGFDVLDGAPEFDHAEQKRNNRRRQRITRKRSGEELIKVTANTRKSTSLNMTVKKLSDELKGVAACTNDQTDGRPAETQTESSMTIPTVRSADTQGNNSDEGELFEFEECETVLPPVYFLNDDDGGAEKWCLLTDLQTQLKFKSKETLLKQICPPDGKKEELVREFKMNEFLQKATCLQLLCSGEKLNIRASKVSLIKYTDSLRRLLGVETVMMRL